MDPTNMTTMQWIMIGGGLGLIVGLIPLITGIVKKDFKFGVFGFFGSIVGGAVLGLLLAIPVAAVFTWLIFKNAKRNSSFQVEDKGPQNT